MRTTYRGAFVVDGTGSPGAHATVVADDGVITSVGDDGDVDLDTGDVVDLDGLVLAPGFVDIHTHLDCQVLWDPDLTPSSWHGVTTVVMGNCGFTIAPTRPEDRETVVQTLENVEGMSADALRAGIDWSFESFPEYLDTLRTIPKRLNVGALVGHSAVRLYVLGDSASERSATDDEVGAMRAVVREAMLAGALGFSTSQSPIHIGAAGKPVPSRLAAVSEIYEIGMALADAQRGIIQLQPGQEFGIAESAELSKRTGRMVTWIALLTGAHGGPGAALATLDEVTALGGNVVPQASARPLTTQFTFADAIVLNNISEPFSEGIGLTPMLQRELYAASDWRARARSALNPVWATRLPQITIEESDRHRALTGRELGDVANERHVDAFDLLIDLALEDDLAIRYRVVLFNDDVDEVTQLLADKRCVLGLSDAGAHFSQLCDSIFPTDLLGNWVRDRGALSLEHAIWRLSDQPARLFGITGRGRIAPGYQADLVAFDAASVAPEPVHRVHDLPAGADRLIADSIGIEHIWVNGVPIRRDGHVVADAAPGVLVTSGT